MSSTIASSCCCALPSHVAGCFESYLGSSTPIFGTKLESCASLYCWDMAKCEATRAGLAVARRSSQVLYCSSAGWKPTYSSSNSSGGSSV